MISTDLDKQISEILEAYAHWWYCMEEGGSDEAKELTDEEALKEVKDLIDASYKRGKIDLLEEIKKDIWEGEKISDGYEMTPWVEEKLEQLNQTHREAQND